VNVKAVLSLGALEETVTVTSCRRTRADAGHVGGDYALESADCQPSSRGPWRFELVGFHSRRVNHGPAACGTGRSTVCPQSSVNITLDGMNIQDNYAKSWDGMLHARQPRLDAVEE